MIVLIFIKMLLLESLIIFEEKQNQQLVSISVVIKCLSLLSHNTVNQRDN